VRIDVEQSTGNGSGMTNPVGAAARLAPEVVGAAMQFSSVTYEHSILPLRVFEAARARTAEINGCRLCQNFRASRDLPRLYEGVRTVAENGPAPDAAFYADVSNWRTSELYDEREKVAIEYAERLGQDPHGLPGDEDFWARAKAAFSDAELVDLSFCIACWMGQGRVLHAMGMDDVCALGPVEELASVGT
jgi:alkylhydroperoxidase family enzyme